MSFKLLEGLLLRCTVIAGAVFIFAVTVTLRVWQQRSHTDLMDTSRFEQLLAAGRDVKAATRYLAAKNDTAAEGRPGMRKAIYIAAAPVAVVDPAPEAEAAAATDPGADPGEVPVRLIIHRDPSTAGLKATLHSNSPQTLELTVVTTARGGGSLSLTQITVPPVGNAVLNDSGVIFESGGQVTLQSPPYRDLEQGVP